MNATGIPAAAPAPPVAATPAAAAATATPAGSDFVGMLMQLVAGGAQPAAPTTALKLPTTEVATDDSDDLEALAEMLAMQQAVPPAALPWAALPTAAADTGADPLELLGLGSGARSASLMTDLTSEFDDANADAQSPEIDGDSANGVGSLSPFSETTQAKAATTDAATTRALHSPVGTDRWAEELGKHVTMMVDRNQQAVSLRLSPEHLGPLEVRISITDDQASVWFGAAHADTRAAIETALPRLREMFTTQGLSLADAGVFREPPRDQTRAPRTFSGGAQDAAAPEGEVRVSIRAVGLLDAYA